MPLRLRSEPVEQVACQRGAKIPDGAIIDYRDSAPTTPPSFRQLPET